MAPWRILYANFQKAYKNRIKVFLEVPRVQPIQVDDTFDDVLRIEKGNLITGSIKVSPHFDADTTALYLKTNQVHAGWQAHFKRPMCAGDLDLMPTVGDGAYTDEEVHWCKETIRYLRTQLDGQGLIDRGLPGARVMRVLRRIQSFLYI